MTLANEHYIRESLAALVLVACGYRFELVFVGPTGAGDSPPFMSVRC
jgi:hypothetical protein